MSIKEVDITKKAIKHILKKISTDSNSAQLNKILALNVVIAAVLIREQKTIFTKVTTEKKLFQGETFNVSP